MKNVTIPLFFIFFFTLFVSSCSKDGDDGNVAPCSFAWATDLQAESAAIGNAAVAYSQDPSLANCNALKNAYQVYLNALKPYGDCAELSGANRADWQQAVEEAEESIVTLCD